MRSGKWIPWLLLLGLVLGYFWNNRDTPPMSEWFPALDTEEPAGEVFYLGFLRDEYPEWDVIEDEAFLELGHLMCAHMDDGGTIAALFQYAGDTGAFTVDQVSTLIVASIYGFCPWHEDLLPEASLNSLVTPYIGT